MSFQAEEGLSQAAQQLQARLVVLKELGAQALHAHEALDEVLTVLRDLRQTWIMLLEQLQTDRSEAQPDTPSPPTPPDPDPLQVGATVNFQG